MSTYRSGLGAQLGVAKEETYGTYKAPSRFLKFENESLALTRNAVETQVLEAGNLVQDKDLHNFVTKIVNGDISMPFFDQGMGILLNLLHGNTVEPAKVSRQSRKRPSECAAPTRACAVGSSSLR